MSDRKPTYKDRLVNIAGHETTAADAATKAVDASGTASRNANRSNDSANAAEIAQDRAEKAAEAIEKSADGAVQAADTVTKNSDSYITQYNDAVEKLTECERNAEQAATNARTAADAAGTDADSISKMRKAVVDAHDALRDDKNAIEQLRTLTTAGVLADAYAKDAKPKYANFVDALLWTGVVLVVLAVLVVVYINESGNGFDNVALTLPLLLVIAMLGRTINDRRMVRQECAHTKRLVTAIIGFKREFGDEAALNDTIVENSPISKVLAAIERNPAERMKVGTDGLWGVLQAFADKRKNA